MIINISELLSTTGKSETYSVPVEAEKLLIHGQHYEFAHKEPVKLTVANIGIKEISIDGIIKVVVNIPCDRCLQDVPADFSFDFHKEIDMNQSDEDRINELDETCYIDHSSLDVDLLVYSELLVRFPMKTLCKEDCRGICPVCGHNLNKSECGCSRESADPRMSVIQDIFNKFKEV